MTQKRTFKTSKGFRTVFVNDTPDFSKNRSDVFDVPRIQDAYRNGHDSLSFGVPKHMVKQFNQDVQDALAAGKDHALSGVHYKPDGTLHTESRQARNAELRRRNGRDQDAGYGDWSGET